MAAPLKKHNGQPGGAAPSGAEYPPRPGPGRKIEQRLLPGPENVEDDEELGAAEQEEDHATGLSGLLPV